MSERPFGLYILKEHIVERSFGRIPINRSGVGY